MIELPRLTGMRPGEVCSMRGRDLVTSGRIWEYRPAKHKTAHHGKARVIFIGPQAQAVPRPWLRPELEACFFQPAEAEFERRRAQRDRRKSKVQPSQVDRRSANPACRPGDHYAADSYPQAIVYASDRAFPHPELPRRDDDETTKAFRKRREIWIKAHTEERRAWKAAHRWHPNQLHHSAATRLRREFGLDVARAVLGHSSPVVTEAYAELD